MDRGSTRFGEETRGIANQSGVISIFGCSVGEVCRESKELGGDGHGVFTWAIANMLTDERRLVPVLASTDLVRRVARVCADLGLPPQTPEVGASSLKFSAVDLLTGAEVALATRPKRMVLIAGPPHTGKSTVGPRVARLTGFAAQEMSSYAYGRWRHAHEAGAYSNSIQKFMEDVVWRDGEYDAIAADLLESNSGINELVVLGARRPEEVEMFIAAGFDIQLVYLYSDSRTRFERYLNSVPVQTTPDYSVGLEEFVRRDLVEYSWGLPQLGRMWDSRIVVNESVDDAVSTVANCLQRRGWWRPESGPVVPQPA